MARQKGRAGEPPARIDLPDLTVFAAAGLEPGGDYEAIDFAGLDLGGQDASEARFLRCRFERCRLDGLALARARLAECLLSDDSGASVDIADGTWRDSLVAGGRIGALTAAGAIISDVRVRRTKLDFVSLAGARLAGVVFEDCAIGELDAADAELRAVRFDGSAIGVLNVAGAKLALVDLSRAQLRVLRGIGDLRGAIVSRDQLADLAPLLAAHAGLEVRED